MLTVHRSRRRLRPGDDLVPTLDLQARRGNVRSVQRSQIDPDENLHEPAGPMGLLIESSFRSNQGGIYASSTVPDEQALVGHTMDQFGNRQMDTTSYTSPHHALGYINEPVEATFYGQDASRLSSALSEAAEHLEYTANASYNAAPGRSTIHAPSYVSPEMRYKAPLLQGHHFPCRYPGRNEAMAHECTLPYDHQQLPLALR